MMISGCIEESKSTNSTTKLTISAASSMSQSLIQLKDMFESEYPSINITYNFGGTGTLRKQIEQGAPVDMFFLASKADYDLLYDGGYIESAYPIFQNKLVIIKHIDAKINNFNDYLNTNKKIAIGTPGAVPAGTYAKQVLKSKGVWDKLVEENRLVFTRDVKHVLTLVKQGEVDVGFVYFSDVKQTANINIIEEIDPQLHEPIEYYIAILADFTGNEEAVKTFYRYVLNEKSRALFNSFGFHTKSGVEK
ncbi:molybdate ABC transporter substrate-binding protein [Lottiidibacillus patelloidae]|nr:molybdate ABC transporter substrate-binding protein [Lottiidibacillus patelloidae]